ncbi:phosphotransferase [Luteolibacter sp. SL250]|uniref:phosphotransferase n=1 Tax=Luteolibacter sp. SL250 TaxID=2995170 RepID=UPI00226E51DB|nr:phosphotransferase [Luteolibacter sp. SL250]WAC20628.1 phosphotransferase [Luteolibacter sp. SL250]
MPTEDITAPIHAATETARNHGIIADRCEILQRANTLVLRLTETLVARVVLDPDGPRQGLEWFERENAVARHLAELEAPVIPMHPDIPPGPHEHSGYPMNFWQYVTRSGMEPEPGEIGRTLFRCHELLRSFRGDLPELAIPVESLKLLDSLEEQAAFPASVIRLLRGRLVSSLAALRAYPMQPLHGDAHMGNLMNTTGGLLWTDWEDTFSGPVEWDLASIIWNARLLDGEHATADGILSAYEAEGGAIHAEALHHGLVARAAVMSAWYPILYPEPSADRQDKLRRRLEWLETC